MSVTYYRCSIKDETSDLLPIERVEDTPHDFLVLLKIITMDTNYESVMAGDSLVLKGGGFWARFHTGIDEVVVEIGEPAA